MPAYEGDIEVPCVECNKITKVEDKADLDYLVFCSAECATENGVWPERVNAMRSVTYDPAEVRESIAEVNSVPVEQVTLEEVMGLINSWVMDDLGQLGANDYILTDENGEELDY